MLKCVCTAHKILTCSFKEQQEQGTSALRDNACEQTIANVDTLNILDNSIQMVEYLSHPYQTVQYIINIFEVIFIRNRG